MTPVESLLAKLVGVKETGNGWSAHCPAHDDQRPSLSVSEGDDGRVLVKCHAGCTANEIAQAAGVTLRDLMPEQTSGLPNRNGKPNLSCATGG
jgi:hypothetical protein